MRCRAASARSPRIPQAIAADIDAAYEVLGEALQTALRAAGVPNGYELLKDFTRGTQVDAAGLAAFIDKLPLPAGGARAAQGAGAGAVSRPRGRAWRAPSEQASCYRA